MIRFMVCSLLRDGMADRDSLTREAMTIIDQAAEWPPYDRPTARLASATAGMTQIVASRHRREMCAIDANHTSPMATVTSSTH
jgi:hypothetical protein